VRETSFGFEESEMKGLFLIPLIPFDAAIKVSARHGSGRGNFFVIPVTFDSVTSNGNQTV